MARRDAEAVLGQARRLIEQMKDPKTKNKLYSLHEPNVDCISKGEARKRYEFRNLRKEKVMNRIVWLVAFVFFLPN